MAVAVVGGTAFAQTPTPTPAPNQPAQATYQNFFLDRLARLLGTSRDQLNSALTQARNDTVDQEVKDGKLTQDQATQIESQQGIGHFGFDGFGPGRMGGPGQMGGGATLDAIASALGMSTQDLQSQLQSGKTLAELASGKEQAVKDAIVAAEKARLDQAVQNGRITQEQENQRLDQIQNSDLSQLWHFGGRGGPGGGGPRS